MNSPSSPPCVGVPGPSASSNPPAARANSVRTAMFAPIPNRPGENGKIAESGGGSSRLNRRARKPLFQASAVSAARSCSVSSRAASTGPLTHASVGSDGERPGHAGGPPAVHLGVVVGEEHDRRGRLEQTAVAAHRGAAARLADVAHPRVGQRATAGGCGRRPGALSTTSTVIAGWSPASTLRTQRARLLARPRVATTTVTGCVLSGGVRAGRSGPSWAVSARATDSAEAWPRSSARSPSRPAHRRP